MKPNPAHLIHTFAGRTISILVKAIAGQTYAAENSFNLPIRSPFVTTVASGSTFNITAPYRH